MTVGSRGRTYRHSENKKRERFPAVKTLNMVRVAQKLFFSFKAPVFTRTARKPLI